MGVIWSRLIHSTPVLKIWLFLELRTNDSRSVQWLLLLVQNLFNFWDAPDNLFFSLQFPPLTLSGQSPVVLVLWAGRICLLSPAPTARFVGMWVQTPFSQSTRAPENTATLNQTYQKNPSADTIFSEHKKSTRKCSHTAVH